MRLHVLRSTLAMLVVTLAGARSAFAQAATAPQLGKAPLKDVLSALTVEEKVKLVVGMGFRMPGVTPASEDLVPERVAGAAGRTHGVARLGIPSLTVSDGPAGVRIDPIRNGDSTKTYYATAFPVGTLLASSWDTALVRKAGTAIGSEVRAYGIDVLLAPGMNIHRNPLGGRNFEYYSEDPLVTGRIAAAWVNGVQSNGVGTSIKHFAANNQEFNRMQLNSAVSERALREIYLKGFEIAVRAAQPWTVMSSYNLINGHYTSESPDLLTSFLRKEWGFKGLVMSDWFGGHDAPAQLRAGNDLLMPGTPEQAKAILAAVQSGALTMQQLDANVTRVLQLVLKSPTFNRVAYDNKPPLAAHAAIAREAAAASMVLLRNEGRALPLKSVSTVALLGNTSYNAIAGGTGSGDVNRAYTISVADGLRNAGFNVDAGLASAYSKYVSAEKARQPKRQWYEPVPVIAELPLDDAEIQRLARSSDIAVITIGRSAGEASDRKVENDFNLTAAEQSLIRRTSDAFHASGKRTIVVLNIGGAIEVASWRDRADAILLAWQGGQEGGNAVADVLSGKVTPSGKLASTFPTAYADVPYGSDYPGRVRPNAPPPSSPFSGQPSENTYSEGVYVGYRYYNTFHVRPAYEFGYGLSYTTFTYSNMRLSSKTFAGHMKASVVVTNSGQVTGKEVVELYLSAPDERMDKPESELKGFAKTALLRPGQSQTVTFTLSAADLASFDTPTSSWIADAGTYTVKLGTSSTRILQSASFELPKQLVVERSTKLLAPEHTIAEMKAPKR
jgi:beta-glucosidase